MSEKKNPGKVTKPAYSGPEDTQALTMRILDSTREDLERMAKFKGALGPTELARGWILDRINEVKADKLYQRYLAKEYPKSQEQLQF